jgi:hypothetical protein
VDRGALKTAAHPTGGSSPGWIDDDGVHEYPLLSTGADDFGANETLLLGSHAPDNVVSGLGNYFHSCTSCLRPW